MVPPQEFLPGYLLYILFIFLPGIGMGEILHLWRDRDSIMERLALALGLGISLDAVVFLIRTSGFGPLKGMDSNTVYLVMVLGLVLLAIPIVKTKSFSFVVKPRGVDIA